MKALFFLLTLVVSAQNGITQTSEINYFGQTPPGGTATVFAPGIISHGFHELGITFSPNGDEIFYVTADKAMAQYFIIHVKQHDGVWQAPEIAPFSGEYSDYTPRFSPDGKRLYFSSMRSVAGKNKDDYDIWMVERIGNSWSDPVHLGDKINSEYGEINPSISATGTIYFQAKYEHDSSFNIYMSRFTDSGYMKPVKLSLCSDSNDGGPFVAPDESYILFHSNKPGGKGRSDIYISYKKGDNWTEPKNLNGPINTPDSETLPAISHDGKYVFYTGFYNMNPDSFKDISYSELMLLYDNPQNGYGTLYWAPVNFKTK